MSADFSNTTLTVGAIIALAGGVWGIIRAMDWFDQKIEDAVQPLSIKMAAAELRAERLQEKVTDFEVSVVRNFVSNTAVQRLEGRMDEGFSGMHKEMATMRDMLFNKISEPKRT